MNWLRKTPVLCAFILGVSFFILAISDCGGDDDNPAAPDDDDNHSGPDTTAPAVVSDLHLRSPTQNSLALVWTAPGDDGDDGTASRYDIRHSKGLITETNWDQATPIDQALLPDPKPGGRIETIVVPGLASGTMYYFALKTSDEVPNESGLSNCSGEATLLETIPPSDIKNLHASAVDLNSFELTWTAPGDDYGSGTATRYDIRYSFRLPIVESNWDQALVVSDPPAPKPAGQLESFVITGLAPGNYTFAMKTVDDLDNWSGLSNLALGLGYDEVLWLLPVTVREGEFLNIVFKANDTGITRISLHEPYGSHNCGERLVVDIMREAVSPGVHTLKFDFIDPDTGGYVPNALYAVSLCYDEYIQAWLYVNFVEP